MKNIYRIIYAIAILAIVVSCEAVEDKLTYIADPIVHFTTSDGSLVAATDADAFNLEVGTTTASPATVDLAINTTSSTAIEGVHFSIANKSVSIGQGEFTNTVAISPIVANLEEAQTLVLDIANSTVGDGVSFTQSFTLSLARLCPVNDLSVIVGARTGDDITISGLGWPPWPSQAVISGTSDALKVTGLGVGWMEDFWGEVIITMEAVNMEVVDGLFVTIPEQAYMTTTYNGAAQTPYTIVGTGVLDACAKTLTIEYDLKQGDDSWASWTSANGYMSDALFTAVLDIP